MFALNHHYHHCPPYSELTTTWVNEPKPNKPSMQYKQSVSIYNGFTLTATLLTVYGHLAVMATHHNWLTKNAESVAFLFEEHLSQI